MELIGKQIELGVGVENVRGTPQSTAEKWAKKITATIFQRTEKKVDESTRNVMNSLGARKVTSWIEGDLEGNVHADLIGYFFYNLFGAVSSSNVSGAVYDHTFSVGVSIQHPSLSLFAKEASNSQAVFDNCMVGAMEITVVQDDYLKFKAPFMGADSAANADTPSYDTEYDFIGRDVVVKFAATEGGLAGATATKVKEMTLKFDPGLIKDHILGQYTPDDVYNSMMDVQIDVSKNYEDDTFKDLWDADTYQYMSVTITGAADIGGGNFPTMTFIFNRTQVMEWSRDDSANELVKEDFTVQAFYNETDSETLSLVLRNLTTEYDVALTS